MFVAGIDVSTKAVDLVLIHQDNLQPPQWHHYPLTGHDAWERTRSIPYAMPGPHSTFWDTVAAIGMENPAGTHGAHAVQRAVGAVLACLPPLALVQPWRPSEWRKAVGLKGNASKEDVRMFALDAVRDFSGVNWRAASYDCTDAYCIALATCNAITTENTA